jgi:hypothetical protein
MTVHGLAVCFRKVSPSSEPHGPGMVEQKYGRPVAAQPLANRIQRGIERVHWGLRPIEPVGEPEERRELVRTTRGRLGEVLLGAIGIDLVHRLSPSADDVTKNAVKHLDCRHAIPGPSG